MLIASTLSLFGRIADFLLKGIDLFFGKVFAERNGINT